MAKDLKEFALEFMESISVQPEENVDAFEEELVDYILEYVVSNGEVTAPEICMFKKTATKICAYDYNEEGNTLDLFTLITTPTILGTVNDNKVQDAFNKVYHFYKEVVTGKLAKEGETLANEVEEVQELILSSKGKINSLRLFVLTNGMTTFEAKSYECAEFEGLEIEQVVWDMQRIYQEDRIKSGKEKIEIDFPTVYNTELQCLKMNKNAPEVDAYLAIIPGITLAKIYKEYKQALLEKNVRTFLRFKTKVNRGIRDTIANSPEMFFSYNNGISTTASRIELKEDEGGAMYITKLYDWQIVNGGQTTASIFSAYGDKNIDLTKVFVPVKISVIHDEVKFGDIVHNISDCANKQNAVKDSDFSSNDQYMVDLEKFSRSEWVPNGKNKSVCKWYFERTRGQYLDELALLTGLNERNFKKEYPKNQKLVKTDVAKYEACWEQHPDIVSKGAENNYNVFAKGLKKNPIVVTVTYWKRMVAKAILYKRIDKIVKSKELGGYKANMDYYIMASLSLLSKKMLDLDYIWEHQDIQPELANLIEQIINPVWIHLTKSGGNQNVTEWAKKAECWNQLKLVLDAVPAIGDDLKMKPEAMIDDTINEAQRAKIDAAWAISANDWFRMAQWAKENNALTPIKRKLAYNYGVMKSRNQIFTWKQAYTGLEILEDLKEIGFTL